jgi:hypothetical protein
LKRPNPNRRNNLMPSISHLPFKWETKCRCTTRERTLGADRCDSIEYGVDVPPILGL